MVQKEKTSNLKTLRIWLEKGLLMKRVSYRL